MSSALQLSPTVEIQQWKKPEQVKARIQAIQNLMAEVLKEDTDFGIIPGMPKDTKPCLLKSGSEQILAMFEIAVEPLVEDLSTDDCARYRVTARLTHAPTGNFLGAGIGEASTDETKYKWKRTYNQKEYDLSPPDRRRVKFGRYKDQSGMWKDTEELQIRQEPADLANTVLKMAKKRAQIDATLTVTGASSMFSQDEDLVDDVRQHGDESKQTRGKKAPAPAATTKVICQECRAENGHLPSCKYRKDNQAAPAAEKKAEDVKKLEKVLVSVLSVTAKQTAAKGKTAARPYLMLGVINQANEEFAIYCWHKTPHEYLTKAAPKTMMLCEISTQVTTSGSFKNLENILELGGVKYQDNKPVASDPVEGQVVKDGDPEPPDSDWD